MGEGGQAYHPFHRFVVLAAGAQQVEESGQKNDLQRHDEQIIQTVQADAKTRDGTEFFTQKFTPNHLHKKKKECKDFFLVITDPNENQD